MQDRYVGDIGDYVKLAILRALMSGRSLGVAWWLFPDEAHNGDRRHISYLKQSELWRHFHPDLFDSLEAVVGRGRRCVQALQATSMLANAAHCDEVIPTVGTPAGRRASRLAWFGRVRAQLSECDLVFADLDNGLETAGFSLGALVGGKCIALSEVAALDAQALIIYHHQTRRKWGHIAGLGIGRTVYASGASPPWKRSGPGPILPERCSFLTHRRRFGYGPPVSSPGSKAIFRGTQTSTSRRRRRIGRMSLIAKLTQPEPGALTPTASD